VFGCFRVKADSSLTLAGFTGSERLGMTKVEREWRLIAALKRCATQNGCSSQAAVVLAWDVAARLEAAPFQTRTSRII
jgi:hypothetical protein